MDKSIYVVGSEQDYHFQVLFKILELLGFEKAKDCYHLSYGMISLPEGRMKSREGKIVDADDLIKEMADKAKEEMLLRGRDFTEEELDNISKIVGLGALKYYILQFSPRTEFVFDPKASIDFNGKTGPYLQYTHARICTLLNTLNIELSDINFDLLNTESDYKILRLIEQYPYITEKSLSQYNTSYISEYLYDLASEFNSFYSKNDNRIKEMNIEQKKAKLALCYMVKTTIKNALSLLGIQAPEKM
jgi:arginyl-tRNA synthetase